MPVVKDKQLIKEIVASTKKRHSFNESQIQFMMNKYFEYSTDALAHGHKLTGCKEFQIRLGYLIFTDIPKRFRNMFTYSSKVFGYTFVPVCSDRVVKKLNYNYRPNKKILDKISEVAESDKVYTLLGR